MNPTPEDADEQFEFGLRLLQQSYNNKVTYLILLQFLSVGSNTGK
jgi:hypothetical protein